MKTAQTHPSIPLLSLCLLLAAAFAAYAEEPETLQLDSSVTLGQVVEQTFARSPVQQVLQATAVMADADARHASGLLPGAPAVTFRHQNDLIGSSRNLREWEAGMDFPIWLPGQRSAREAVALEARAGQGVERAGAALEIAGRVREAVWDRALSASVVDLAEQRRKTAESLLHDVERRHQAGELAKTDVMLAQNEVLQARTEALQAQAELKHAEHRYWILTGLASLPSHIDEIRAQHSAPDDTHPLLAAAQHRVLLAQQQRNLTRAEQRENPQLLVNVRHDRGAFDSQFDSSVGVAVRIPLQSEVRAAPLVAASEMQLAEATSAREQLRLALQAAAHEAEHNLETLQSELDIVSAQNHLAQENLRLAKKAFDLGESDFVNLLRIRQLAFDANKAEQNVRIRLQQGIARYNQAMGVMP